MWNLLNYISFNPINSIKKANLGNLLSIKNWYSNIRGYTTRTITRTNIKSVDISKVMIAK